MKSLHPNHLADLHKSGLTKATIQAAGVYTVPPNEIGKKLGGLAHGLASALAFPYPGYDGFERFKVWREEGKTGPKYLQRAGTPNHLYFLPADDLQGDAALLIVEGEKKKLSLGQAGFLAIGIGGVFNWLTKGEAGDSRPIPDFDLVNWVRPVSIVFDSDAYEPPKPPHLINPVRLAAFRLARELCRRGATVNILFIPCEVRK